MVIWNSHCSFYFAATLFSRYVYPNLWNRYCSELFFYQKEDFNVCWQSHIDFLTMSIFCHLYFQKHQIHRKTHYLKDSPYLFSGLSFLLYQTVARNKLKGRKDLFCLISKRKSLWEDVECLHIFAINFLSNILTLTVVYIPG